MTERENSQAYDVAVLGGGTGGYSTALRAAELGKRVVLIERDERIGGTCLLRGCIPTKALLQSAAVTETIRRSEEWGVRADGEPDMRAILAFKAGIVDKLVSGLSGLIATRGIELVKGGEGRLAEGPALEVAGQRIEAGDVVLATGSFARTLPGIASGERIITSDRALDLETIPGSMIVIGAGAVGLEFASFYRSMGAEVTVLEAAPRLAPLEDADISKHLQRAFKKRGIACHSGASVKDVVESGTRAEVVFEVNGREQTVTAEYCLVAVGRGPLAEGFGFEEAGVKLDRGFVRVDGTMRTTAPRVWAVGDVSSSPLQFAHVAFAEGIAVAERIAGQDPPEVDYVNVPRVTFSTPEISSVGLTEEEARERGFEVAVETFNFQALGKANILGEGGVAKTVAEPGGGRILGVHMLGPHATDLISEAMLITNWEATAAEVAALIHPHPTLSESIGESALALAGKPLHTA